MTYLERVTYTCERGGSLLGHRVRPTEILTPDSEETGLVELIGGEV